jgi:cell division protein FtsB
LSQVANTFWDDRVERVGAAARVSPLAKRKVRARRLVDAIILAIVLAASATCVSIYSRGRAELVAAQVRHQAAGERLEELTIKVEKLERDVKQLRTDSKVIELFARQKFGFVRSGDVVIKVSEDEPAASPTATGGRSAEATGGRLAESTGGRTGEATGGRSVEAPVGRLAASTGGKLAASTGGKLAASTGGRTGEARVVGVANAVQRANLTPRSSGVYTDASN